MCWYYSCWNSIDNGNAVKSTMLKLGIIGASETEYRLFLSHATNRWKEHHWCESKKKKKQQQRDRSVWWLSSRLSDFITGTLESLRDPHYNCKWKKGVLLSNSALVCESYYLLFHCLTISIFLYFSSLYFCS